MTPGDETDALYGRPLDEFTRARNDLARTLRADGRRDEAAGVAALRKPSLSAWVVNQLAREHRSDVQALLEAAAAIKAGAPDGDARFRASVDRLLSSARKLLESAGRRPADSVLQEVATTLRAFAAAAPDELAAGRVSEARETSGFDALAGVAPPSRPKTAKAKPPARPKAGRAEVDAARRALTEARGEARTLRRLAAAAEHEARRAEQAADDAEKRVTDAERHLESLPR